MGEFLLLSGHQKEGIAFLKQAAAANSFKNTRVLAAHKLHSLGETIPPPGAVISPQ